MSGWPKGRNYQFQLGKQLIFNKIFKHMNLIKATSMSRVYNLHVRIMYGKNVKIIHLAAWIIAIFSGITNTKTDCHTEVVLKLFNFVTFNKLDVTLKRFLDIVFPVYFPEYSATFFIHGGAWSNLRVCSHLQGEKIKTQDKDL